MLAAVFAKLTVTLLKSTSRKIRYPKTNKYPKINKNIQKCVRSLLYYRYTSGRTVLPNSTTDRELATYGNKYCNQSTNLFHYHTTVIHYNLQSNRIQKQSINQSKNQDETP